MKGRIPLRELEPNWFLYAGLNRSDTYVRRIKRLMDIFLPLAAIVVSSPFLLVAAVAVKMTSPGPVIYGQDRVGQHGKMFRLLEFRSMVQDAERATGPVWSREADGRTTRVGKVLRRFGVDEVPQLTDVLRGE